MTCSTTPVQILNSPVSRSAVALHDAIERSESIAVIDTAGDRPNG
jgi:hypothetical protein